MGASCIGGAHREVREEPSVPSRMRRSVRTRLLRERTSTGRPRTSLVIASCPGSSRFHGLHRKQPCSALSSVSNEAAGFACAGPPQLLSLHKCFSRWALVQLVSRSGQPATEPLAIIRTGVPRQATTSFGWGHDRRTITCIICGRTDWSATGPRLRRSRRYVRRNHPARHQPSCPLLALANARSNRMLPILTYTGLLSGTF